MKQRIKLGFVGSQGIHDQKAANKILDLINNIYEIETVISGGAKGADKLGIFWARYNKVADFEFFADWGKYGKKAGIIRNGDIINNVNFLVAFWDGKSPGTHDTITRAEKKNIPIVLMQPIQSISFDVDSLTNIHTVVKIKGTSKYEFRKALYVSRNGDIQMEVEPDVMHTYEACYVVYFNNMD